ncbi:MAG: hypothetical protein ACRBCT_03350 [Alphaproteobacteria bacterium]
MTQITIGCLALQGCVDRHAAHVEAAGAGFAAVKTPAQFEAVDGFILPGGESTTMLKLIERFDLWDSLAAQFAAKPVWGICAGAILLAEKAIYQTKTVSSCGLTAGSHGEQTDPAIIPQGHLESQGDSKWATQKSFGILPYTAIRNGYGRQIDSEIITINGYDVSYIRAPILKDPADHVQIHARRNDLPVWVRSGKNMATTFHPELTLDTPSPMHTAFVDIVKKHKAA